MWIILIVLSIAILFSVSIPLDNIIPVMQAANVEDVPTQWNTFSDRDMTINLVYVIIYALPIIGGINFIATAVRRQEYDENIYLR